jgi:glycerophosphoryl diester phosphodiesterase
LIAWTVDDPEVAKKLVELGVDGITTNRPGWLREQLK